MVSRRYAIIAARHPAAIPRAVVLCVLSAAAVATTAVAVAAIATARSWWRPVPICASREPPSPCEYAAHTRCTVASEPLCEQHPRRATRSEQGVPDNDRHVGACAQA